MREKTESPQPSRKQRGGVHFAMMACCALMLVPLAYFVLSGGVLRLDATGLSTLAPIVLCVGAHLLMFKFMGKSCHGTDDQTDQNRQTESVRISSSDIPNVERH